MYQLAFERTNSEVQKSIAFNRQVEAFNERSNAHPLYVSCNVAVADAAKSQSYFTYIDSLSAAINRTREMSEVYSLLMLRAVAYSALQNFESAIDDLSTCLQIDSTSVLSYWQRAVCQAKINDFQASQGTNIDMKTANVLLDLTTAIRLAPQNAFVYYNRGNLYVQRKDFQRGVEDYTQAISLDANMAEAYYNRGLALVELGKTNEGIDDLSKAGELGLYTAYSLIKKYRKQ
jgi:tetratricopeptide (TPR) repeat protein